MLLIFPTSILHFYVSRKEHFIAQVFTTWKPTSSHSVLRWYIFKMIHHFLVFHNVLFSLDPYLAWLMYLGWLMPHLPCYTLIQGLCFIRLPIVIANKLTMQPHEPCHAGCCQHQLSIRKQQFWVSICLIPSILISHSAIGAANAHFFIGMSWAGKMREG